MSELIKTNREILHHSTIYIYNHSSLISTRSTLSIRNNNISSVFHIYPRFKLGAYHVCNIEDYDLNRFSLGANNKELKTLQMIFCKCYNGAAGSTISRLRTVQKHRQETGDRPIKWICRWTGDCVLFSSD